VVGALSEGFTKSPVYNIGCRPAGGGTHRSVAALIKLLTCFLNDPQQESCFITLHHLVDITQLLKLVWKKISEFMSYECLQQAERFIGGILGGCVTRAEIQAGVNIVMFHYITLAYM
jgi:hypothetical protein